MEELAKWSIEYPVSIKEKLKEFFDTISKKISNILESNVHDIFDLDLVIKDYQEELALLKSDVVYVEGLLEERRNLLGFNLTNVKKLLEKEGPLLQNKIQKLTELQQERNEKFKELTSLDAGDGMESSLENAFKHVQLFTDLISTMSEQHSKISRDTALEVNAISTLCKTFVEALICDPSLLKTLEELESALRKDKEHKELLDKLQSESDDFTQNEKNFPVKEWKGSWYHFFDIERIKALFPYDLRIDKLDLFERFFQKKSKNHASRLLNNIL